MSCIYIITDKNVYLNDIITLIESKLYPDKIDPYIDDSLLDVRINNREYTFKVGYADVSYIFKCGFLYRWIISIRNDTCTNDELEYFSMIFAKLLNEYFSIKPIIITNNYSRFNLSMYYNTRMYSECVVLNKDLYDRISTSDADIVKLMINDTLNMQFKPILKLNKTRGIELYINTETDFYVNDICGVKIIGINGAEINIYRGNTCKIGHHYDHTMQTDIFDKSMCIQICDIFDRNLESEILNAYYNKDIKIALITVYGATIVASISDFVVHFDGYEESVNMHNKLLEACEASAAVCKMQVLTADDGIKALNNGLQGINCYNIITRDNVALFDKINLKMVEFYVNIIDKYKNNYHEFIVNLVSEIIEMYDVNKNSMPLYVFCKIPEPNDVANLTGKILITTHPSDGKDNIELITFNHPTESVMLDAVRNSICEKDIALLQCHGMTLDITDENLEES